MADFFPKLGSGVPKTLACHAMSHVVDEEQTFLKSKFREYIKICIKCSLKFSLNLNGHC
jgi:hypothetical protein